MRKTAAVAAGFVVVTVASAFAVVGGGDVTMKGGNAGDVTFRHDTHVSDVGLGCKKCHDRIYLDTKRHKRVTMKQMQQGKSCGACHNGKEAFSVKGNCTKCHQKQSAPK